MSGCLCLQFGTRSADTVVKYALGCARVLIDRGVKVIVVGCNRMSAVALDDMRVELDLRGPAVTRAGDAGDPVSEQRDEKSSGDTDKYVLCTPSHRPAGPPC